MRKMRFAVVLVLAFAALPLTARTASAQGCIAIRNNEPLFGASEQVVFAPGEWQVFFNFRDAKSTDHYNGTKFQYQRQSANNYVSNTQQLYDLGASYNVTQRFSVSGLIPVVNATWSLPTPTSGTLGPRREQNASGIGDVSAQARFWLLDPVKHPRGNWSVSLGFKAPTGEHDAKDEYPDITATNDTLKAVDQSIQPGDGGWGVIFETQAYKTLKHMSFYGSGFYLANPRDTNGTPSIIVGLGLGANPAFADLLDNSVPDQYLARVGASFPVIKETLSVSIGFRIEGVPRYDLVGASHGWRRPGYETYVEPGIVYTRGRSSYSVNVPIGLLRNRLPNPYSGNAGDATFPDYVVVAGYSYRFGGAVAPTVSTLGLESAQPETRP